MSSYDPWANREVAKPLNYAEALFNLLKAFIGTGILAMPVGFKHTGWLLGLIATVIIAGIMYYGAYTALKSMYELCKRQSVPLLSYKDAMTSALLEGPQCCHNCRSFIGYMVDTFLIANYMGVCSVYLVFMGRSIEQIVEYYTGDAWDGRFYILLCGIPVLIEMMIRYLKYLAPLAMIAITTLGVGIILILAFIYRDLPPLKDRPMVVNLRYFPIYFGDALFSFTSIGVIIALEQSMRKPQQFYGFFGVMSVGFYIVTTIYDVFGFSGYWKYGEKTLGSVTLNIPQNDTFAIVVKILYVIGIFLSYGLNGYIAVRVICTYLANKIPEGKEVFAEYMVRIGLVIVTLILAVSVPKLGIIISLVGSLCSSSLCLIFPGIMSLCVRYTTGYGRYKQFLIVDILIIIIGILAMITGTTLAILAIVDYYRE